MTLDEIKALLANKYNPNGRNYTDLASFTNWVAPSGDQVNRDLNGIPQIISKNADGSYRLNQFESDNGKDWNISGGMNFANQDAVDSYFRKLDKGDSSFLTDSLKEAAPYALKFAGLVAGGNALLGNGFGFNLPSEGGLLGESAALNSNQVGALSGGAEGATFSQIPGSSVAEAFGAPSLELGSGLAGQGSAIASGAAGGAYVSPFASGALTQAGVAGGMSALSPAALAEIAATTGMSTAGLGVAAGGAALKAPVADGFRTGINSFDDALQADALAASKYEPSILDKILDKAQANPLQAAKAVQGLLSVAGAVAGNDDEDKPYKPGPIDQSIVSKYKNIPSLAPIRYQQGYSLALPTGLLNNKPSGLLGG